MPALAKLDLSKERVLRRLQQAKSIALDQRDMKALRLANKALAKMGCDNKVMAGEIELEVENDCVRTALYRHYDKDGNLLYVGVSLSVIERTISHRDKSHWFNDIARIDIEWLPSRSQACYHEIQAIKREKPRHNIKDNASPAQ